MFKRKYYIHQEGCHTDFNLNQSKEEEKCSNNIFTQIQFKIDHLDNNYSGSHHSAAHRESDSDFCPDKPVGDSAGNH